MRPRPVPTFTLPPHPYTPPPAPPATADYDHIEPIIGVTTANASAGYDGGDTWYVNNDFGTAKLARPASGFSCTASNKHSTLARGGCVPAGTRWGYAVRGPAYAGIGPPVALTGVSSAREPAIGRSAAFTATLTVRNLTVGASYKLHRVTGLAGVPASASGSVPGPPLAAWVATAREHTFRAAFKSNEVAYYIATAG